jgi:hypothetical protein
MNNFVCTTVVCTVLCKQTEAKRDDARDARCRVAELQQRVGQLKDAAATAQGRVLAVEAESRGRDAAAHRSALKARHIYFCCE